MSYQQFSSSFLDFFHFCFWQALDVTQSFAGSHLDPLNSADAHWLQLFDVCHVLWSHGRRVRLMLTHSNCFLLDEWFWAQLFTHYPMFLQEINVLEERLLWGSEEKSIWANWSRVNITLKNLQIIAFHNVLIYSSVLSLYNICNQNII